MPPRPFLRLPGMAVLLATAVAAVAAGCNDLLGIEDIRLPPEAGDEPHDETVDVRNIAPPNPDVGSDATTDAGAEDQDGR